MTFKLRFPSLFWTFSVAFLVVLILAVALQSWITVTLLTRLRVEFAGESAAHSTEQIGKQIAALEGPLDAREIIQILRRHRSKDPAFILMFRPTGGALLPDRRRACCRNEQLPRALAPGVVGPGGRCGHPGTT